MRIALAILLLLLPRLLIAELVNPFSVRSNLYTFAFHEHCNVAPDDGTFSTTNLATTWRDAGINAFAITPHTFVSSDPAVSGIRYFGGQECFTSDGSRHLVGIFVTNDISTQAPQDVINSIRSQNGFAIIAHPWMTGGYGWTTNELLSVTNWNATEIFPFTSWGEANHWDMALTNRMRVWATIGPDAHDEIMTNCYVCVNANSLDDIREEMISGNFYPSTGARIAVSTTNSVIYASSTALGTFVWFVDGASVQTNSSASSASMSLQSTNIYARFRFISDAGGLRAYSQPVFQGTRNVRTATVRTGTLRSL